MAGDYVTYADFVLYDALDFNRRLVADNVDFGQKLTAYLDRIESLPKLVDYFKSDRFKRVPIWGPMAYFNGTNQHSE